MKKFFIALFFIFTSVLILTGLNGCGEEDVVKNYNPVTLYKGVFVLYEGVFNQPQSYDYGFIDTDSNTVTSNVFQNSNNGSALNAVPDGMLIIDNKLFIVAQGSYGQPGTIYKIDSRTNALISYRNFGTNPYSLIMGSNAHIYVTSTASDYVTMLDNDLNIIEDSIRVGFNPSEIVRFNSNVYVAKQSYTFERSLAIINTANNQVSKIFFNTPPVCVETGADRVYVSTYSGKKIYSILPSNNSLVDSMEMNIPEPAIGTIVYMDAQTLFVLGIADTSYSSNVGKRIYKIDMQTKIIDPNFNIIYTGNNDVYGLAYHSSEQKLYAVNSRSGTANGEVNVYDKNGNLVITYPDIGGKFPKRIAFLNF